jgi:predicted nucleic acid-binding protein
LSRTLRGCTIDPIDEKLAKAAGVLLGESETSDAVDAIVVAMAFELGGIVVTSDPDDLRKIADGSAAPARLVVITI